MFDIFLEVGSMEINNQISDVTSDIISAVHAVSQSVYQRTIARPAAGVSGVRS